MGQSSSALLTLEWHSGSIGSEVLSFLRLAKIAAKKCLYGVDT